MSSSSPLDAAAAKTLGHWQSFPALEKPAAIFFALFHTGTIGNCSSL
jgi:hypothetical protein